MKKLNLVVGILVAAALVLLVVLLVQTFFSDADTPDTSSAPPVSTAPPTAAPSPTDGIIDTPEPSGDVPTTPEGEALEGETLTLEAFIGREKLTFTYSSELYTRMPTEIGEQFFLKSDTTNETFIEIIFIEDDLELRKASFLDSYIADFTQMDTLGQILIAGSNVAAEGLYATNGAKHAEAWLIEVESGFFAVVAGYHDDSSRSELYRMLDTLAFSL